MIPQYEPIFGEAEANAVFEYMKSGGWVTEFKKTVEFEEMIMNRLNVGYCSAVNNGTISLSIALLAVGIKPGDKVLVPNLTMIATPNAVRFIGAVPVFVDIESENLCMDLDKAYSKIRKEGIKALIYVTLNGRCINSLDYKIFIEYCRERGVSTIEDSAQSLCSKYDNGKHCGTMCDISSFSFSIPKIISTGQGGCLVTNDNSFYRNIEKIKDFGRISGGNDIHDEFGINSKFTELQAVIGIEQMKTIEQRIAKKVEIDSWYREYLPSSMFKIKLDNVLPWFIDIYVDKKTELQQFLATNGIGTRAVYPPITSQKVYSHITDKFPVTKKWSDKGLWLPSSMNLTRDNVEKICMKIKEFYNV